MTIQEREIELEEDISDDDLEAAFAAYMKAQASTAGQMAALLSVEGVKRSKHAFRSRLSYEWRSHTKPFVRQAERVRIRKVQRAARKANRG